VEHSIDNSVEKHADSSREDVQQVDDGTTYYNICGWNDYEIRQQEVNGEDVEIVSNKRGGTHLGNEGDTHHRPHESNETIATQLEGHKTKEGLVKNNYKQYGSKR